MACGKLFATKLVVDIKKYYIVVNESKLEVG